MLRLVVGTVLGFAGLAALGAYKEKHDLDYCQPARRLRWMAFEEELKQERRKRDRRKLENGRLPKYKVK